MHYADQAHPGSREASPMCHGRKLFLVVLLLALGTAGILATGAVREAILARYEARIYPNVYALGVNLGGLTLDEATVHLTQAFKGYRAGMFTLSDGERAWQVAWSDAGLRLDAEATAEKALAVGRADPSLRTLWDMWRGHQEVAPVFVVDPQVVRGMLEQLAPQVYTPPTDATLCLEGDQLVVLPGQAGWELDIETTLEKVVTTVAYLGPAERFALSFRPIPPRIADVSATQAQAEELLNRQVHVSTYDALSGESFAWTLARDTVATWLRIEQAGGGPAILVIEEAVRATLERLAAELGEGRGFRLEEATGQVLDVFQAGGGTVELRMMHPPRSYIVQAGDTLNTIAARLGMPPGLIGEANPGVDLDRLHSGQELTIPAEDVLRPYVPVPGKRIVISVVEQRMRVYENDALLYEWPVSTGMAGSPTYTGEFQILSKEHNAYAGQWDLWMPHFMAVYRAGGSIYNGIHALPILSNGQRLWEGALGSPASYGCIILGVEEAETLFNWAEIGVPVTIE